jgi:hypothetical protein
MTGTNSAFDAAKGVSNSNHVAGAANAGRFDLTSRTLLCLLSEARTRHDPVRNDRGSAAMT